MAEGSRASSIRPRQRRDGTVAFDVRYRLDGRSKTLSFETRKAAERWAGIVRAIGPAEALKLVATTDGGDTVTVDQWADTYIRSLSGVEGKTLDHYRLYMRVSISPSLGSLPLDAVTPQRIAEWINGQATRYASKTIKNRHGFLSAMFQAAVDEGLIDRNPCGRSRLPESEHREMVFLSYPEYRLLLEYIPAKHRPMVELIAGTGLRWGEVSALKPADFDWAAGTVRISRSWKSSTDRGWYIGPPKTRKSKRTIALPGNLIDPLRKQAALGHEFVFVNRDGAPIRQQKFWEDVWNPARRMANGLPAFDRAAAKGGPWDRDPADPPLGKWPRIHDLRHSHAAWLIADGVPLPVIQARLGHESIQTTVDVYGHLSPDMLRRPVDTLDRLALTNR